MAVKRFVVVDPGTVPAKDAHRKKSLKHPGKQITPSHPATEVTLSPVEIGTSSERTAEFDPRAFLSKLLLANFGQESKPIPLIAKITQKTLAEMIGTTRSRVGFFMNRFRGRP